MEACPVRSQALHAYESHLESRHPENFTKDQLPALLEMSQRALVKMRPTDCPLCDDWEEKLRAINSHIPGTEALSVTTSQFQHHLGAHMEQLALFAIPRGYTEEGEADSGNAAPQMNFDSHSIQNSVASSSAAKALRHCEDVLNELAEHEQLPGSLLEPTTLPPFSVWIRGQGKLTVFRLSIPEIRQRLASGKYRNADAVWLDMTLMFSVHNTVRTRPLFMDGYHVVSIAFDRLWTEYAGHSRTEVNRYDLEEQIRWKLWKANTFPDDEDGDHEDNRPTVTLSVKMQNGERATRIFDKSRYLEDVYTFVECYSLICARPFDFIARPLDNDDWEYHFMLRLADSSKDIHLDRRMTIGEAFSESADLVIVDLGPNEPLEISGFSRPSFTGRSFTPREAIWNDGDQRPPEDGTGSASILSDSRIKGDLAKRLKRFWLGSRTKIS
ncbi:hypothetical protein LZ554_005020 [Drepanopeziza brunnea f. sp. 'monogermtubi']|nr:hypothetical protein LZ554_005020 [Drepanopeziza brunnea f. sp. 'monogermtubi']